MYHSILVPLDGSSLGEQALPMAMTMADRANSILHLVHVCDLSVIYSGEYLDDQFREDIFAQAEAYLMKIAHRVKTHCTVPVQTAVLERLGLVSDTISAYAAEQGLDLVVMTTHGRGGFARILLGSVADELVRQLPMPLLLVHPREQSVDLKPVPKLKHVLVAVDGTEFSEHVVRSAVPLAKAMNAQITLLQVVEPVEVLEYHPTSSSGTIDEEAMKLIDRAQRTQDHILRNAERSLKTLAAPLQGTGLEVLTRVVVESSPNEAILGVSEKEGADVIVLETHGRSGISRWVFGSVADEVIRHTTKPVLVHRPLVP